MIKIIRQKLSPSEVKSFLGQPYDQMIKFVIDIERNILAMGGELHADAEKILLEDGSSQQNLWGGNFYPLRPPAKQIEYTSLINIRPSQGNLSLEQKDQNIRTKMFAIIKGMLL
jgi:hypothetical protein